MSGNEALYRKFLKKFLQVREHDPAEGLPLGRRHGGGSRSRAYPEGDERDPLECMNSDSCDAVCKNCGGNEGDIDVDTVYNRYDAAKD